MTAPTGQDVESGRRLCADSFLQSVDKNQLILTSGLTSMSWVSCIVAPYGDLTAGSDEYSRIIRYSE